MKVYALVWFRTDTHKEGEKILLLYKTEALARERCQEREEERKIAEVEDCMYAVREMEVIQE